MHALIAWFAPWSVLAQSSTGTDVINIILYTLFFISTVMLILFVLFRPSESSGLSGAFGGMGSDQKFGLKTTQLIDKIIMVVSIVFILCAIFIAMVNSSDSPAGDSGTTTESGQ